MHPRHVFDLLCWKDLDLTRAPLLERRGPLKALVVRHERIRIADYVDAAPKDLLAAVREQGLEGIVGKEKDSQYQPGKRWHNPRCPVLYSVSDSEDARGEITDCLLCCRPDPNLNPSVQRHQKVADFRSLSVV